MLVSIGTYAICNGTLTGGVAVSDLRFKADRLFDFVVPVGDVDSVMFDRVCTTFDAFFMVQRSHATIALSEAFILQLDSNIPTSGIITFTTTGPGAFTRTIPNGYLVDHELIQEMGATTFHQYHISGGAPIV